MVVPEVYVKITSASVRRDSPGKILKRRVAGLVMRGKSYDHQFGQNLLVYYGMVATDADIITSDGKSPEHVGVVPDELMLPTADDLATARDPVLAHAGRPAGLEFTPEKAGALFLVEWRK